MSAQASLRSYPEMPFAPRGSRRVVSVQHTATQNHILAALPSEDYKRLLPYLEAVSLPLGWTVHEPGSRENYLYFLAAGIVYVMENGAAAAFAVTGNEGVIGVAAFLSGESTPSQAVALSTGYAYRLRMDLLKNESRRDASLLHLLLRYTQALITQTAQTAACNRHHTVEQQLCRWILSCLDRLPSNELAMTQELIAQMLGVRREGITEAAGNLQKAGLINCRRGHITVVDRPNLERHVCECYAVVKREYDRLHRPDTAFGNAHDSSALSHRLLEKSRFAGVASAMPIC